MNSYKDKSLATVKENLDLAVELFVVAQGCGKSVFFGNNGSSAEKDHFALMASVAEVGSTLFLDVGACDATRLLYRGDQNDSQLNNLYFDHWYSNVVKEGKKLARMRSLNRLVLVVGAFPFLWRDKLHSGLFSVLRLLLPESLDFYLHIEEGTSHQLGGKTEEELRHVLRHYEDKIEEASASGLSPIFEVYRLPDDRSEFLEHAIGEIYENYK